MNLYDDYYYVDGDVTNVDDGLNAVYGMNDVLLLVHIFWALLVACVVRKYSNVFWNHLLLMI